PGWRAAWSRFYEDSCAGPPDFDPEHHLTLPVFRELRGMVWTLAGGLVPFVVGGALAERSASPQVVGGDWIAAIISVTFVLMGFRAELKVDISRMVEFQSIAASVIIIGYPLALLFGIFMSPHVGLQHFDYEARNLLVWRDPSAH